MSAVSKNSGNFRMTLNIGNDMIYALRFFLGMTNQYFIVKSIVIAL